MAKFWQTLKQLAGTDDIEYPKSNPISGSGKKVMAAMKNQYGEKKGKAVFYATMNKKKMQGKWES